MTMTTTKPKQPLTWHYIPLPEVIYHDGRCADEAWLEWDRLQAGLDKLVKEQKQ